MNIKEKQLQVPMLAIEGLCVTKDATTILDTISLTIPTGVMAALVGPNGAGKTTLLHTILGINRSYTGTIFIWGEPFSRVSSQIAFVPQRTSVDWDFPVTVSDVVMMGRYVHMKWFARPTEKDYAAVEHALHMVGMFAYKDRPIGKLSGGQQQRVFIARALAQEPLIYFMDEPFAGIDSTTEHDLMVLLKAERDKGKTVVIVHHDLETLAHYFEWVVLLNKKIIASGPVNEVFIKEHVITAYGRWCSYLQQV